jgi:integrase
VPTMNSIAAALRFFFTLALNRSELARKPVRLAQPRKLPVALSRDEVARLLNTTISLLWRGLRVAANDPSPLSAGAKEGRDPVNHSFDQKRSIK